MITFRDKASLRACFEYLIYSHEFGVKSPLLGFYFKLPEGLPSQFSLCNIPQKSPHVCLKLSSVDSSARLIVRTFLNV